MAPLRVVSHHRGRDSLCAREHRGALGLVLRHRQRSLGGLLIGHVRNDKNLRTGLQNSI